MTFIDFFKKNKKPKSVTLIPDQNSGENEQFKDVYTLALVHKLRTPLNGARWALDTIINDENKDSNRGILNEGYNKIISAINIVNEILKVAEINTKDGFSLKKEKINLCVVVDEVIKNLQFLKDKNEITIEYNYVCDPTPIYGDKEVLDIAFTNIFDNAYRYSPKGKVSVFLSRDDHMANFVIKDNGIGIDSEDLKHVFEKFYRGKNAKIIDSNESGIGLFSTKRIIELHRGQISIDSEINKGTTLEVKLPID